MYVVFTRMLLPLLLLAVVWRERMPVQAHVSRARSFVLSVNTVKHFG